ncbi:hypothetical protein [Parageobacillus thermoglucosidasius]|uniref:hypothetical protein n=1 Tax=Parageobacillus thermoglucosidasius TaxID=1426 RepID=UPI002E2130AE|nr:hypothetical protein [Parageobacillus thermoglucosidasius]MED4946525.1 hypothetical protein [Parageobacillus thermoglucosidasius]MED4984086.1 hypothetical protein [Parageobacillus thermoglucosidasius]
MTNKKYIIKRARKLRSVVKGVSLPESVRIVKSYMQGKDTLETFRNLGFKVEVNARWEKCECCGSHYRGTVALEKNGHRSILQYDDNVILP